MTVYTKEFIAQIIKEFNEKSNFDKIELYNLCLSEADYFKTMRNEIEEWVSDLPKEKQETVITKLRMENFIDTYNELVVGNILKKLGFEIEYEKNIEGKTPDWYVYTKDNYPAFIVEVLTINFSKENEKKLKNNRYFRDQLESIPIGVVLYVKFGILDISFNKGTVSTIKNRIQEWLINCNQQVGETFTHSGVTFEILSSNKEITHVLIGGPVIFSWRNIKTVKNTIRKKVRNYREVVNEKKIPFFVGIVDESVIGFCLKSLKEILFDERNGFFNKKSILSSVIWVYRELNEWKVKPINNLNAINKLPSDIFGV